MKNFFLFRRDSVFKLVLLIVAFSFIAILYGSVPYVTLPTLGQAFWVSGFAQSLANSGIFEVYAENIGYPEPSALAFGLSGAIVINLLINLGFNSVDSYSIMNLVFIFMSFWGMFGISKILNLSFFQYVLSALLWFSFPCLWNHLGYSLFSVGIILLPFYYFCFYRMLHLTRVSITDGLLLTLATVISVFTDGYTFVMFFFSAFGTFCLYFLFVVEEKKLILKNVMPWISISFLTAYLLYTTYLGKSGFEPSSMDFFRAWGVDIAFLLLPSKGVYWLWDALGISISRSGESNFGDASVWTTTFVLPIFVVTVWIMSTQKGRHKTVLLLFFAISLLALYMALGPSVKFFSVRPLGETALMHEKYALFPTGNELIYKYLPGVNAMRATYRWISMFMLFQWLLIVYWLSVSKAKNTLKNTVLILLIVTSMPSISAKWDSYIANRDQVNKINEQLILELKRDLYRDEVVAFLPYSNDFLVNYIAPALDIKSFNIGGDKNLASAKANWPQFMRGFSYRTIDSEFYQRVMLILLSGEADKVVLPFIDFLPSAHNWNNKTVEKIKFEKTINELSKFVFFEVSVRDLYIVVSVKPDKVFNNGKESLYLELKENYCPPGECIKYRGYDPTYSMVGVFSGDSMKSSGRKGYLAFGPYSYIEGGEYSFLVEGYFESEPAEVTVDIFSSSKEKIYFQKKLSTKDISGELKFDVVIPESVPDLEVRFLVEEGTIYELKKYSITRIN